MSDTNRVGLAFVEEVSFGVHPGTKMKDLRKVSEGLVSEAQSVVSNEMREDRQVTDLIRTGLTGGGPIKGELSYGAYDDFLEAALMSAVWDSEVAVLTAGTASAAATGNKFTHTTGFDDTPAAGEWIYVSGFANSANNGFFRCSGTPTSTEIVVEGGTVVDETDKAGVTITRGAKVRNGTTFRSFSIEKSFEDLSNEFEEFTGMFPDELELGVSKEGALTCGFNFAGKIGTSATATTGDGSNTAAPTADVYRPEDVAAVLENLSAIDVTALSLTLKNNARRRQVVGTLGAKSIGTGKCDVEGSFSAYYESSTLIDKFLNGTATKLSWVVTDAAGNDYVIDLPRVKLTAGKRVAGGADGDVIQEAGFRALRDPTLGFTIQIARFPAA